MMKPPGVWEKICRSAPILDVVVGRCSIRGGERRPSPSSSNRFAVTPSRSFGAKFEARGCPAPFWSPSALRGVGRWPIRGGKGVGSRKTCHGLSFRPARVVVGSSPGLFEIGVGKVEEGHWRGHVELAG